MEPQQWVEAACWKHCFLSLRVIPSHIGIRKHVRIFGPHMPAQKNRSGKPTKKTKRGGHFQIEIWLKKSAWFRNIFSESSRRQDCEKRKGAPSLDVFLLFYCIGRVFSGASRPLLGSLLGGHIFSFKSRNFFRGPRSHFLVQISELCLEGCIYIFSAILGVQTPALNPPKNMILARCSDTEDHRKWVFGSVSRGSLSGNCHVLQQKDCGLQVSKVWTPHPCRRNKERLLADQVGLKVRFEGSSRCGANWQACVLLSCLRAQPELCHRAPECVCGVSVSVRVSWVCLCACSLVLMQAQQRLLQWRMLRKRKQDKKPPSLRHFCLGVVQGRWMNLCW